MRTLEALKKLAKKLCSTVQDIDLEALNNVDEVLELIAEKFDGGTPAA